MVCISNDIVSFNKESFLYFEFDKDSDAFSPKFKEAPIVFSNIDLTDETSFILLSLIEIKKPQDKYQYQIYGMNVIPIVTAAETIISGVFEIPLLDLEISPSLFEELNDCNPWQFQFRYLKEKKASTMPASIIFRQNNADLGDMLPAEVCEFQTSQMFMPNDKDILPSPKRERDAKSESKKVSSFLHSSLSKKEAQHEIREYVKRNLYLDE